MIYEDFLSLVQSRRSIRRFSDRTVTGADLLRLLEAARWAPSNHNRQPWKFIVLEDRKRIAGLAEKVKAGLAQRLSALPQVASGYGKEFLEYAACFAAAPVVMLILHRLPASFTKDFMEGVESPDLVSGEPLSTAMAVQNLLLAAHVLGLGTCMLTAPLLVREVIAREVALPPGHQLTCLLALGHPAEEPPQPRRKSIEQIAEFMEHRDRLESQ